MVTGFTRPGCAGQERALLVTGLGRRVKALVFVIRVGTGFPWAVASTGSCLTTFSACFLCNHADCGQISRDCGSGSRGNAHDCRVEREISGSVWLLAAIRAEVCMVRFRLPTNGSSSGICPPDFCSTNLPFLQCFDYNQICSGDWNPAQLIYLILL